MAKDVAGHDGCGGALLPLPPVSPLEFSGIARDDWERLYPQFIAEYYRLVDRSLRVFGDGGTASTLCGRRLFCGGCEGNCDARKDGGGSGSVLSSDNGKDGAAGAGVDPGKGSDAGCGCRSFIGSLVFEPVRVSRNGSGSTLESSAQVGDKTHVLGVDSVGGISDDGGKSSSNGGCQGSEYDSKSVFPEPVLGSESDRETKRERNRRWRQEKKEKKNRRKARAASSEKKKEVSEPSEVEQACVRAKETLAKKWTMENELAAERARRSLEVIRASDLQDDIRRHTTRVKRHTEANMVAIEKTHKYLSKTGNVAGEPAGGQGFAETIIGESISPDSSASMQEFRAAQKQILDLQQENEKLKKAYQKAGGNPDAIDLYDKSLFTMENGTIDQRYVDQFEDLKLSWGFPENAVEYKNGKMKTRVDFYGVKDDDDFNNFYGDC